MTIREPPFSEDAEQAVLSAMLMEEDAIITAHAILPDPAMFYSVAHQRIYGAMLALYERNVALDPITLSEELARSGSLESSGGKNYIGFLVDAVPTAANVEHHAKIVLEKALLRYRNKELDRTVLEIREEAERRRVLGTSAADIVAWQLEELKAALQEHRNHAQSKAFPAPISIRELIDAPEPEEQWIAKGLFPADANLLIAGYPKSHKTNLGLETGVGATAGLPILGRFDVERRHRVGLVLMEDRSHRVRRRLRRICAGHGIELEDLEGYLHLWFRPPLKLSDPRVMDELRAHVDRLELDLLWVDSWAYVATGNSNDSDEVAPQLDALSGLRETAKGLTVGLTHHARKKQGEGGGRLTDDIRNSSHFSAWYDGGYMLSRENETSPVTARAELRDHPSLEPFAFKVEDQFPSGPDTGAYPTGWLRLTALDATPATIQRDAAAAKLVPAVREFLGANPGTSKAKLRAALGGRATDVDAAFEVLAQAGAAYFDAPEKKGQAGRCWLHTPLFGTTSDHVPATSRTPPRGEGQPRPTPLRGGRGALTSSPDAENGDEMRDAVDPQFDFDRGEASVELPPLDETQLAVLEAEEEFDPEPFAHGFAGTDR